MFEAAIGTALAFIFLMFYFDIKKVAGMAVILDVLIFGLMLWLFKGTYAGMMTGMIAGLIITFFLRGVRSSIGYKKVELHRAHKTLTPMPRWVEVPGKFSRR